HNSTHRKPRLARCRLPRWQGGNADRRLRTFQSSRARSPQTEKRKRPGTLLGSPAHSPDPCGYDGGKVRANGFGRRGRVGKERRPLGTIGVEYGHARRTAWTASATALP